MTGERGQGWDPEHNAEWQRDLAEFQASRIAPIFDEMRGYLWHCTGPTGFLGIHAAGEIRPNAGQFPSSFPQSANSYARHRELVSIFDLATPSFEQCVSQSWKWTEFFMHYAPTTISFALDRAALAGGIVSNAEAKRDVGYTRVWIPFVEAFHRGTIPIATVRRYLIVPKRVGTPVWYDATSNDLKALMTLVRQDAPRPHE